MKCCYCYPVQKYIESLILVSLIYLVSDLVVEIFSYRFTTKVSLQSFKMAIKASLQLIKVSLQLVFKRQPPVAVKVNLQESNLQMALNPQTMAVKGSFIANLKDSLQC